MELRWMLHLLMFVGLVSWYGPGFFHARTASGEIFVSYKHTCASRWLRFGTLLRLRRAHLRSWCRVNDRGPFVWGRVLDVSPAVARDLNFRGVVPIQIEVIK